MLPQTKTYGQGIKTIIVQYSTYHADVRCKVFNHFSNLQHFISLGLRTQHKLIYMTSVYLVTWSSTAYIGSKWIMSNEPRCSLAGFSQSSSDSSASCTFRHQSCHVSAMIVIDAFWGPLSVIICFDPSRYASNRCCRNAICGGKVALWVQNDEVYNYVPYTRWVR